MATKQPTKNGAAQADNNDLPGGWERVEDDYLVYTVREQYEHSDTGLVVTVQSQQRPDQMHDPRTSKMDTGYVSRVRGDVGANICHGLAAKTNAQEAAQEFMAAYPDGEFEVPSPRDQPYGDAPIDWRAD